MIQFNAVAGSALNVIDYLGFMVLDTGVTQAVGWNWFSLHRVINADVTTITAFDWDRVLPEGFNETGTVGYYNKATSQNLYAHHLIYRGATVTARLDTQSLDDQLVAEGGLWISSPSFFGVKSHIGETYVSEVETLDVDSVQDPITGAPLQIDKVLVRFGLVWSYKMGRTRSELVERTSLENEEDFDIQLNGFEGVIEQPIFPSWRRAGRVIIRAEDSFPWLVSAVIPVVEIGDLDLGE